MTGRDWAAEAGIPKRADGGTDWAAAAGITPGPRTGTGEQSAALYRSALDKKKAGKPLTRPEAEALARQEAAKKVLSGIGVALQPFQVLSDITKGLIGEAKGIPGAANRGIGAAAGHLTYGLAEYLPGATGARARGVTGAELLKGTRYEGNAGAALAVELLADPSILLAGAGLVAKGGATAGRLAQLEKVAKTPEGAALIRGALRAANTRGDDLLRLSDEVTAVPAAARGVAKSPVGKAVKGAVSKAADVTLPQKAQDVLGVRTVGDAFFTPDVKRATYTPEQLARDEFRDTVRLGADDLRNDLNAAVNADTPALRDLVKGLPTADAQEATRLLGVFTTTTNPAVAQEALRKLTVLSQKVGKPLEKPFVAAVKAVDRVGQQTLGRELAAQGLPVVLDPKVTAKVQAAESGADLVALVGKYQTEAGRPRGILMTQYVGRADVDRTIQQLAKEPELPALAQVEPDATARTLTAVIEDLPPPPARPIEPVGVAPKGTPPVNPPSAAVRVAETPVNVTPPRVESTAPPEPVGLAPLPTPDTVPPARPPVEARSPQAVLEELFSSGRAAALPPAPVRVTEAAPPPPAPIAAVDAGPEGALPTPTTPVKMGNEQDIEAGFLLADRPASLKEKGAVFQHYAETPWGNALVSDGTYAVLGKRGTQKAAPGEVQFEVLDRMATAPIVPVVVNKTAGGGQVWFDNTRAIPLQYFDDVMARFPGATFREALGMGRVVAYHKNQPVALLPISRPGALSTPRNFRAVNSPSDPFKFDSPATPPPRTPAEVLEETLSPSLGAQASPLPVSVSDNVVSPSMGNPIDPDMGIPISPLPETGIPVSKTPAQVIQDVLSPGAPDPFTALPSPAITRTSQDDVRDLALPEVASERLVERAVPTTYRTVEVDANALDWASLPDDSARRAVLNSLEGAGNAKFVRDAQGAVRLDRPNITVPLNHPTVSRYFDDDALMAAQRTGTELGERTIVRRESVPEWYNPRDPAPLEVQRGLREQAQREAAEMASPNNLAGMLRNDEPFNALDPWLIGDAYASYDRLLTPGKINPRAAANDYARRVQALTGRPPTRGEVFQYRLALSRYRQAANLRNLDTRDAARHLAAFYRENPEATLWEGVLSTARALDLGRPGAQHLQQVLAQADSGFTRRMSRLERLEFAQFTKAADGKRRGVPGGLLIDRLKRRPEEVSAQFEQVFPLEVNAVKVLDEQVRTRTAAIVRTQVFREYHQHLRDSGQHLTARELKELRTIPVSRLDPRQRALREQVAGANEQAGLPAGWKVMDRAAGPFEKGDAVPWWAYHDLFGASSVDDAAVTAGILGRANPDGTYDRLWRTQNAMMLGSPSSIVNDQVGQLLQMAMWGVTPDAVIEGMIRRATATPAELAAMRKSGVQSAKLESNIGAERQDLQRLAARLDGDTEMTRMGRVVDKVLRFRERGTGIDPNAMTGPAGMLADVAHLGSGYTFRLRSAMSDLQRESLYFHRIALGDAPAQAARYANDVLMDMRLVPAYARLVSRVWPFFNWIAMSGPRSVVTVLRKPGIAATYQRLAQATDQEGEKDDARRVLARDAGYFNLGVDERNGTRVYIDPRNWDPTNTIPQLMDWSGTKVGAVSYPWWLQLVTGWQSGIDRFGNNIYADVLDSDRGGGVEAFRTDPKGAAIAAARFAMSMFQPSYAPGSSRAQAFVKATIEAAKLPEDGSRDIALAKLLTETPQGRAYLLYLQSGTLAALDPTLKGNRGSQYSDAPPSMGRAAANFLVPLRGVNADQDVQGTAQQKVSVELLKFNQWLSGERKRLAELEAGGASPERIRAEENRIEREAAKRSGQIEYLDRITR